MAPDGRNEVRSGPNGRQVAALGDRILISHHLRRLPPCRSTVTHGSGSTRARACALLGQHCGGLPAVPWGPPTDADAYRRSPLTDQAWTRARPTMRRIARINGSQGESNVHGNLPQNEAKNPQLMSRSASAPPPASYSSPVTAWRTSVIGAAYGSHIRAGPPARTSHAPWEAPGIRTGNVCWTSWTDVL